MYKEPSQCLQLDEQNCSGIESIAQHKVCNSLASFTRLL